MANFQKHGKNVNGQVLAVPSGSPFELGLWGPVDTRNGSELDVTITPNSPTANVRRAGMLTGQPARVWTFSGLPQGRTFVEAKDRGGLTWTSVTLDVSASGGGSSGSSGAPTGTPGSKYTDNPNEVGTQTTTPTAVQVIDMLLSVWPDLNNEGARVLTSQFMCETGGRKYCFNWNLGNVKASAKEMHMYLKNVWECYKTENVDAAVAAAGGAARAVENGSEEARRHGWKCPQAIVVFSPPHAQCRFRAYPDLESGAKRWVAHHQKIAGQDSSYLPALKGGDIDGAVHSLKKARYFTAGEEQYAHNMKLAKARIDKQLGPSQ